MNNPPKMSNFFAVTVVSNFTRYKRRPELYRRFDEMMQHAGVPLITVELSTQQRDFEVTRSGFEQHLQLRSQEEFWHKENLINLGISLGRRLYPNATKVAWLDADCRPAVLPRDWFTETWHQLEHYQFVQMWEWLQPLDYHHAPLGSPNPSFMANYIKFGTPYPKNEKGYPVSWGSPGLAWAANIDAIDAIGGIPDVAILGAGDWYLAHMLTSGLELGEMKQYSEGYRDYWAHKQLLCERHIKRDVGYVKGLVFHDYHGKTVDRGYNTREGILIRNKYDPRYDIKRDHQGVYQMETYEMRQIKMYDQIRAYFRARNEDSIDT